MKLFLASNSGTAKSDNIKLLEKACKSAIMNTSFEVFVIFDGKKEEVSLPGVTIIEHRHRCYDVFQKSPRNTNEGFLNIASGTFLRTEIPYLLHEHGMDDKFVLYTDYDVLFLKGDYTDLDNLMPKYFAACPEGVKTDYSFVNAGVMLLNVDHFLQQDEFILSYIRENFEDFGVWDQTMYNNLYKEIDRLPLEYNWKTYWGINESAKIIHFHGAKPESIEPKWRYELPEIKAIRNMNSSFNYYDKIWETF
jgi:hypothetical protein